MLLICKKLLSIWCRTCYQIPVRVTPLIRRPKTLTWNCLFIICFSKSSAVWIEFALKTGVQTFEKCQHFFRCTIFLSVQMHLMHKDNECHFDKYTSGVSWKPSLQVLINVRLKIYHIRFNFNPMIHMHQAIQTLKEAGLRIIPVVSFCHESETILSWL